MNKTWIIYGAYGFTGRLIAQRAVERGLTPVVAGRDPARVTDLAQELGVAGRSFKLDDAHAVADAMQACALVLNCAGPFTETSQPLAEGAIRAGCHYLDITGEVDVFENLQTLDERGRNAGVMLMPGVGFDVVPTDCVAVELKRTLPDAAVLELAFVGPNKAAAGSIKTALRALPEGGLIREAGRLRAVPHFSRHRQLRIDDHTYTVYAIPWGDLSTAFRSTAIPDIVVYTVFPTAQVRALSWSKPLLGVLRRPAFLRLAERIVEVVVRAPSDDYLETSSFYIWGEVRNAAGARRNVVLRTRDTYTVTRQCAVEIVERVLSGHVEPGFQTPATVYGPRLIDAVDGTVWLEGGLET